MVRERVSGYLVDDGDVDSVELSCEGKNGCDSDARFRVLHH